MAPRDVPPPSELLPNSPQHVPQEEDSFEIVVMVPMEEDTQEAQWLPQNDNHGDDHEDEEEEGNEDEDKDDEDYTPLSDSKMEKVSHDADEIKTIKNEALIPTGRLSDLLNCLDITTSPEFREFRAQDEKSTRQLWRSSVDLMCIAITRVQLSLQLTRMQ
jgi:hypothetical protein